MFNLKKFFNQNGWTFSIETEDGILVISFCGNLDLYFNFIGNKNFLELESEQSIKITKENCELYYLFLKLYEDIKNFNVYEDIDELDKFFNEELRLKEKYNLTKLFHDNIVEWHSDESAYDESSVLKIKKIDDAIELIFNKGKVQGTFETFSVRISNSGSRYSPFNIVFMRLYKELINYNPDFHQITFEELEYIRKLKKD